MVTKISRQWNKGDKVKVTVELPDGKVTSYEGNIATVLVGDDTSTKGTTFCNASALDALNHVNALTKSRSNLIKAITEDIGNLGGGGKVMTIKRISAIGVSAKARDTTFALKFLAAWFGGKTRIADIPAEEIKRVQCLALGERQRTARRI